MKIGDLVRYPATSFTAGGTAIIINEIRSKNIFRVFAAVDGKVLVFIKHNLKVLNESR